MANDRYLSSGLDGDDLVPAGEHAAAVGEGDLDVTGHLREADRVHLFAGVLKQLGRVGSGSVRSQYPAQFGRRSYPYRVCHGGPTPGCCPPSSPQTSIGARVPDARDRRAGSARRSG